MKNVCWRKDKIENLGIMCFTFNENILRYLREVIRRQGVVSFHHAVLSWASSHNVRKDNVGRL